MKRPMLFISSLSQPQIEHLKSLSDYKYSKYFSKISKDTQVYTYSDGTLELADNPSVDPEEEIICTTYDEFLTCWSEYKLWLLLET